MPDSLRDAWTGPRGGLSQIEFHTHVASTETDQPEAADTWLGGQSVALERLRVRAQRIGSEGAAVVSLHGDVGVGKLRVAQWVHRCSSRSVRPLLVLDADDPTLFAQLDRVHATLGSGRDSAPGTLVLRNWERARHHALERLLSILSAQGVELLCGLVFTTKRTPEQLRACSTLHAQLLARAARTTISVPALRHRGADIGILARTFVEAAADRYDKSVRGLSPQALSLLETHDFPGNVRELELMVEQAVIRSTGDWVTGDGFPGIGARARPPSNAAELVIRMPGSSLREIEVAALTLALETTEGKVVKASELLGITRHALRRKLKKFNLNHLRATPPGGKLGVARAVAQADEPSRADADAPEPPLSASLGAAQASPPPAGAPEPPLGASLGPAQVDPPRAGAPEPPA